jgi:hypothetical protein
VSGAASPHLPCSCPLAVPLPLPDPSLPHLPHHQLLLLLAHLNKKLLFKKLKLKKKSRKKMLIWEVFLMISDLIVKNYFFKFYYKI